MICSHYTSLCVTHSKTPFFLNQKEKTLPNFKSIIIITMSSNSSFNTATPNFDNLLLQTLMGRLQIRPPNLLNSPNPFLNQTLEDLLLDTINNLSSDNEEDDDDPSSDNRTQLAKEESKLEKEIIKTILGGKSDTLKPNSGQAVTIGEHHICVGYHEESGSDYRVWEWHGHIMLFDEENGYTPEYIYGNYFERVIVKPVVVSKEEEDDDDEKEEDKVGNLGLRELIETVESGTSRILHRNMNAPSSLGATKRSQAVDEEAREGSQ